MYLTTSKPFSHSICLFVLFVLRTQSHVQTRLVYSRRFLRPIFLKRTSFVGKQWLTDLPEADVLLDLIGPLVPAGGAGRDQSGSVAL